MSKQLILDERSEQLASIEKGTGGRISLNTRITHEANEQLNYIWAMKQAEHNFIKYPKQLAVEYAIHTTYIAMTQGEQIKLPASNQRAKRDISYYQHIIGSNR